MFTKEEAIAEINATQDAYVDDLVKLITGEDSSYSDLREIDFTSPTGTGKTVMVAKLLNRLPEYFFVVTTLSRGQLRHQIEAKLKENAKHKNFLVYGLNEYTTATRLQADEILKSIPWERKVVWIRDEGHIATNRWAEILQKKADRIVNFSATNKSSNGIQCNFTHTMMLRTVTQMAGTPEDALDKLVEVKKAHRQVNGYNPCALLRVLDDRCLARIMKACDERGLRYINITEEAFDMSDLCRDDNEIDVIINKFKITEGIDLRRCHVIYMDSKPGNEATVVQVIGRARRNALFWRKDIDILSPSMEELLCETRRCYIFYNVPETEVGITDTGELMYSLCDTISIEALKSGVKIKVTDGQLQNGFHIIELAGKTGTFSVKADDTYHFNIVDNPPFYYLVRTKKEKLVLDLEGRGVSLKRVFLKPNILEFFQYQFWEGGWKEDKAKYKFYLVRKYGEYIGSSIDFDYWGRVLGVEKKGVRVKKESYWAFARDSAVVDLVKTVNEKKLRPRDAWIWELEAHKFSKKGPSFGTRERKGILTSGHFAPDFVPYVDRAEYYDVSLLEDLENAVFQSDNVIMLGLNRYRVSNHPLSGYFEDKGITSFQAFKERIARCSGKTIFTKKLEYWKTALTVVGSFEELDEYDSRIVNLEEINRILGIGLPKNAVKTMSKGELVLRTTTPNNIGKISIYPLGPDRRWAFSAPKKVELYRRSFEERFAPYEKTFNDREIAMIGPDTMKYVGGKYIEDRAVTSKIGKFCKFSRFLRYKYAGLIRDASKSLFSGHNDFGFDNKCNSCLGFCVEYFAKIKLYGDEAYKSFVNEAMSEAKVKEPNDIVRVRAAMLIYKEEMIACYGVRLAGIIPTISVANLISENYGPFVKKVIELGLKTKDFVLQELYGGQLGESPTMYDPDLSVNHISALCDFITQDTILDVKCTSSITPQHVLQVLAYHYLSTKRSDLNIKRVIVYEAVTGKSLTINIPK